MVGCSETQVPIILEQDYSFLRSDGSISKLKQSNDTLFDISYYADTLKHESRNKIISAKKYEDFTILILKNIDVIPKSHNYCPGKEYSVLALKKNDNMQLESHYRNACFNRNEIDTYRINLKKIEDKDALVYLSDSYLKELSVQKTPSTIDDIIEILNSIENNDFNSGEIVFSANELNKACIGLGYNPAGVALTIDSLLRL